MCAADTRGCPMRKREVRLTTRTPGTSRHHSPCHRPRTLPYGSSGTQCALQQSCGAASRFGKARRIRGCAPHRIDDGLERPMPARQRRWPGECVHKAARSDPPSPPQTSMHAPRAGSGPHGWIAGDRSPIARRRRIRGKIDDAARAADDRGARKPSGPSAFLAATPKPAARPDPPARCRNGHTSDAGPHRSTLHRAKEQ